MINFVLKRKDFEEYERRVCTRFTKQSFKKNPFKKEFKYFIAFEFDFIYDILFFEGIKTFVKSNNDTSIVFYTRKPHPEKYFYKHFKKYSIFEFEITHSYHNLNEILSKNPGNLADALEANANEICWFSNSDQWAMISSREWEISVIGFTKEKLKTEFLNSFDDKIKTIFNTIEEEVDQLDEMLQFSDSARSEYRKLVANYQDRI